MGAGKTTVLGEASDLLTAAHIVHAGLDFDAFGIGHLPDMDTEAFAHEQLAALCDRYAAAGVTRLLLSDALTTTAGRERLRQATRATSLVICRLRATLPTMQQRIRLREPGLLQEQFVARVVELEAALDASEVEDFSVDNDARAVTEVAREMLTRAGWL